MFLERILFSNASEMERTAVVIRNYQDLATPALTVLIHSAA
jgi:hypothetical protein